MFLHDSLIEEGSMPRKQSLVGEFLGRPVALDKVHEGLVALWNPQPCWEIFPMGHGYFIFRFMSTEDLDRVLTVLANV